jgi:hypothetical protein
MTSSKDDKLPLNDQLSALDRRDFDWYKSLSEEQRKEWSSWTFMRFASSVKGSGAEDALLATNEFVNTHYADIYKHEELLWKLFCLTGSGKKQYHEWIKPPNSKSKKDNVSQFVSRLFPHFNSSEIELFLKLNSVSDIKQIAEDMGMDEKEIEDIFGKTKKKKK